MTTAKKTPARKTPAKDTTKLTDPEVVVKSDEVLLEEGKTAAQIEAESENSSEDEKSIPTFTVEINGEEIELEDRWDRDNPPGAMMFMGNQDYAEKYAPGLVDQLIGEDQIIKLLSAGADAREIALVARAWAEERGLKN